MVLLEKVNFQDLKPDKFRSFKCLCELCDDGCFDRTNQTHHADCSKKKEKTTSAANLALISSVNNQHKCPLSHYSEMFKANYDIKPVSSIKPLIDNAHLYVPQDSTMDFNTTQKLNYKPIKIEERTKPFKSVDNYELPTEPFTNKSIYTQEFFCKDNGAFATIVKKNSNESSYKMPVQEGSNNTTTQDHFKNWNSGPEKPFSEHPSMVGNVLFPTRERTFISSNQSVHRPMTVKKPVLPKVEFKGSIQIEGEMDFQSVYRDTYLKHKGFQRTKKIEPKRNSIIINRSTLTPNTQSKLNKTQTKSDFGYYPNFRPPKPADCNPFNSKLNEQIYPGNKYDLQTNYSIEYTEPNQSEEDKAKSFKKTEKYEPPTEKFETETVTQKDFKPIDITKIPSLKAKKLESMLKRSTDPMEMQTTKMLHYVAHKTQPIQLAKDPNPEYYIAPMQKFIQNATTTAQTYQGIQTVKPSSFKPDFGSIETNGSIDFKTSYRDGYTNHGLTMCEAKAYLISKSLANIEDKAEVRQTPQLIRGKTSLSTNSRLISAIINK